MDKPASTEETVDRLIAEARQLHLLLKTVRHELRAIVDLDSLSLQGAVAYLVRQKRLLDEVKRLLKRANNTPGEALNILLQIESLIDKSE